MSDHHSNSEPGTPGDPGDATEQMISGIVEATRAAARRLPRLYVPMGEWSATSAFGEWAATDDRTDRASVLRADDVTAAPIVVVHTVNGSAERAAFHLRYGDRESSSQDRHEDDEIPGLRRHLPSALNEEVTVRVDGVPRAFRARRGHQVWYAWAEDVAPGIGLVIEASGVDPDNVTIASAADRDVHSAGQRALIRQQIA